MDYQAVIHFVGLVVLTTQPLGPATERLASRVTASYATPTEVVLIMPTVPSQDGRPIENPNRKATATAARRVTRGIVPPTQIAQNVVATHTAMIAFEPRFELSNVGWLIKPLNDEFIYIELKGEQISFIADRPNDQATIPKKLAHLNGTLQAAYRPPYKGAAAVFNIPTGTMNMCISQTDGVNGRRDTQLLLNNSGVLIIKSGAKVLTLEGSAVVYAANVPLRYGTVHDLHTDTPASHLLAYCGMTGTQANCQIPKLDDNKDCISSQAGGNGPCPDCTANDMRMGPGENLPPPEPVALASFECSNTQWP